ncbi:MAG: hypothetical protein LUP94_03815 [Candidatus Methanomethylicus sp.]|nr:hypothetical protein [Candidatus Methanomethylicus sp.]
MEKMERDSSIKDLSSKLDQILNRLDFLEKVILDKPQYSGLATSLQMAREDAQRLSQAYDSARAHLWSFVKEAGSKERTVSRLGETEN